MKLLETQILAGWAHAVMVMTGCPLSATVTCNSSNLVLPPDVAASKSGDMSTQAVPN